MPTDLLPDDRSRHDEIILLVRMCLCIRRRYLSAVCWDDYLLSWNKYGGANGRHPQFKFAYLPDLGLECKTNKRGYLLFREFDAEDSLPCTNKSIRWLSFAPLALAG